jgi:hypothetical protein
MKNLFAALLLASALLPLKAHADCSSFVEDFIADYANQNPPQKGIYVIGIVDVDKSDIPGEKDVYKAEFAFNYYCSAEARIKVRESGHQCIVQDEKDIQIKYNCD